MPTSLFTNDHTSFVAVLIEARHRAGLTQVELARKLGRTQRYVSLIEVGQRRVDVIEFFSYAKALGVSPRALFAEVAEKVGA